MDAKAKAKAIAALEAAGLEVDDAEVGIWLGSPPNVLMQATVSGPLSAWTAATTNTITTERVEEAVRHAFDPANPDSAILLNDREMESVLSLVLAYLKEVPHG